ncbi:MAG: hypothetical protein WA161_13040 [Pseudomonas sp.]|uniref:hypothetical protein n=1 Tax=Pseudomonas sp. TaxID=306 RepID=UPI003BB771D9
MRQQWAIQHDTARLLQPGMGEGSLLVGARENKHAFIFYQPMRLALSIDNLCSGVPAIDDYGAGSPLN